MPATITDRLNNLTTSTAIKPPCVAVASSNITLSGLQTIGSVTVAQDDRVLVIGQTDLTENGIYNADTGDWTRAKDFDGNRDAVRGTLVLVRNQLIEGAFYELTTANPVLFGSSSITFALRDGPDNIFDQTQAEIDAGKVPVDRTLPEGHVERYLAWANSSTDFTTAFQAVAAVARAKPGLTIQFTHGRTYAVWPLGTGSTLFDFDGANGITVEGNGALISAGEIDSTILIVFDINAAEDVTVRNLGFTQTYDTLDLSNGAELFLMRKGSRRMNFENCRMVNGRIGIGTRGTGSDGPRCENITAINCRFDNVYYPQNFQNSGDNYFARGIKTQGCGRSYFPWNVRNHDVEMMSQQGGPFHDVLMKVFADPGFAYNRMENMRLVYWSDGKDANGVDTSSGSIIGIDFHQVTGTTTAAEISNIDIVLCVDAGVSPTMRKVVDMQKFTSTDTVDTTTRGYTVSNLTISGRVRGWANATSFCIDLFSTNDGASWTGESAINIKLCNLLLSGTSGLFGIVVNGQPFNNNGTPGLILENVFTEMRIDRLNWNEQKAFDAVNVVSSTIVASNSYQAYTPVWSGSGGAATLGNGTIFGRYMRRGDRIKGYVQLDIGSTSVAGAGVMQFSLPTGAAVGEGNFLGSSTLFDSGTRSYSGVSQIDGGASVATIYVDVGQATGTAPFTIANGDSYKLEFDYICAPA